MDTLVFWTCSQQFVANLFLASRVILSNYKLIQLRALRWTRKIGRTPGEKTTTRAWLSCLFGHVTRELHTLQFPCWLIKPWCLLFLRRPAQTGRTDLNKISRGNRRRGHKSEYQVKRCFVVRFRLHDSKPSREYCIYFVPTLFMSLFWKKNQEMKHTFLSHTSPHPFHFKRNSNPLGLQSKRRELKWMPHFSATASSNC